MTSDDQWSPLQTMNCVWAKHRENNVCYTVGTGVPDCPFVQISNFSLSKELSKICTGDTMRPHKCRGRRLRRPAYIFVPRCPVLLRSKSKREGSLRELFSLHSFANHGEFNLPEHVIREIAQSLIPDLIEFYQSEKGQEEFKKYLEEKNKKQKEGH